MANPTVQAVANYLINNPATQFVGSGLAKVYSAFDSTIGRVVSLPNEAILGSQYRTPLMLGAVATFAAAQTIFRTVRYDGVSAGAALALRTTGQAGILALKTIVHLPVDILKLTFTGLPLATLNFVMNIHRNILNIGLYLATSKLVWAASPYVAAKISYHALCNEYEAEVSKTEGNANFVDRIIQGYELISRSYQEWLNSADVDELLVHALARGKTRAELKELLDARGFDQAETENALRAYDLSLIHI